MSEITPGPWELIDHGSEGWSIYAPVGEVQDNLAFIEQLGEANARAIAAVPDMLVACMAALPFLEAIRDTHDGGDAYYLLEAAIAKAAGKQ